MTCDSCAGSADWPHCEIATRGEGCEQHGRWVEPPRRQPVWQPYTTSRPCSELMVALWALLPEVPR